MTMYGCFFASIQVVCLLGMYLYMVLNGKRDVDLIIFLLLSVLTLDNTLGIVFRLAFPHLSLWSDAAPFGLIYGPLLYWVWLGFREERNIFKRILPHLFPFILAFVAYLLVSLLPPVKDKYMNEWLGMLYISMCFSWLWYSLMIFVGSYRHKDFDIGFLKYAIVLLLIAKSCMLPMLFDWKNSLALVGGGSMGLVMYGCMLTLSLLIFNYFVQRLKESVTFARKITDSIEIISADADRSILTAVQQQSISDYLNEEPYSDSSFNVTRMAEDLQLPKMLLSQYFFDRYGDTVIKTVNAWRVAKACRMLEQPNVQLTMEELAFACGFNSRASFYRNFNLEKGCSPSAYRERFFMR